ncbi:hypothetical protein ACFQZQ_13200 [Lysobacter koreensis]|uniref:ArsR family transcriptional regulator n=1 Tax=Lysobacter koreensis TaxID=266122 RepID=A0ABW2YP79_9GAMM
MDPISLEELALLEVLVEIDHASKAVQTKALQARLADAGLVEAGDDGELKLTDAGIERCKSLHHRVRADREAAEVLKEREQSGEAAPTGE